jgi:hypothetical protein
LPKIGTLKKKRKKKKGEKESKQMKKLQKPVKTKKKAMMLACEQVNMSNKHVNLEESF